MTIKVTYNVTDVYMSQSVSPVYINVSYSDGGASGGGVWGSITGTLSNQTDLQTALDLRVPYSGATGNVNLGEYELKAGQVTLDTSPTGTAAVGTIRWNDTTGTSETTLKGGNVIIKNGVDLVARVVNKVTPNTTLTKAAYQAVRVSGAQGQRLAIELAQANNDAGSADTIGLVTETIAPNQEGFIMTVGQLEGINTTGSLQGETWVDGDVLYLSPTTAGRVTNIKPTGATGHIVVIGYVEYAHQNNGKIYVKVMNGWELDELHNVSIVTPTNNQGLFYNSSNSLWENKTIATVLGYSPEQPLTFNSPLSRAGNVVSIPQATGSVNGFLSATDWTTFNSKQAALGFTPANAATTLTINGVTFDLSANRTWTIAAGISGSGAAGQVTYWTGASAVSGSNNLFWDNINGRLGIGTNAPTTTLTVNASVLIGTTLLSANTAAFPLQINLNNTGSNVGAIWRNQSSTGYTSFSFYNDQNLGTRALEFGYSGSAYSGAVLTGGVTGESAYVVSTGAYALQFGTNNAFRGMFSANGNFILNSTTDGGQRLQVIGDTLLRGSGNTSATTALTVQNSSSTNLFTVRNDGLATFGGNVNITLNQNASTLLTLTNTTSGASSNAYYRAVSNNGYIDFGRTSSSSTAYKIIAANNSFIANGTSGDIAILNDVATGTIKMAAGASTTSQMTLFANGNLAINSGVTDLGVRFGVVGDTLLRGSGATSATTALTVQNSSSTNLLTVRNDGFYSFRNSAGAEKFAITDNGVANNSYAFLRRTTNLGDIFQVFYPAGTISATNPTWNFGMNGNSADFVIAYWGGATVKNSMTFKTTGQTRFEPLASAPASPQSGDVYYDSTLNKLRVYTTAWETITSV